MGWLLDLNTRNGLVARCGLQRRNFELGLTAHKPTTKLVAIANADQPRVVPGATVAQRQQFFQHDRDLTPLGVPSEYSCSGAAYGSSLSCVAPAMGRLMLANLPPFSFVPLPDGGRGR